MTILDSDGGFVMRRRSLRKPAGRYWAPLDAALDPLERWALVSYHGGCTAARPRLCTTGADVIRLPDGERQPCPTNDRPAACAPDVHGATQSVPPGVLATTGSQTLVRLDASGKQVSRLGSRLSGNHLMEVAADLGRDTAYALGSCREAGGLSFVDLRSRRVRVFGRRAGHPARPRLCGERIAVSPTGMLVLAGERVTASSTPTRPGRPQAPGQLLIVSGKTGRLETAIRTMWRPIDVMWL